MFPKVRVHSGSCCESFDGEKIAQLTGFDFDVSGNTEDDLTPEIC